MGVEVKDTEIDWVGKQLKNELDDLQGSKFYKDTSIKYLKNLNKTSYAKMMEENSGATIVAIQVLLKELGYTSIGKIDGILKTKGKATSSTMETLKDFQRKNNIRPVDGLPGPETVNKLLEKFESGGELPQDLKSYRQEWDRNIRGYIDVATNDKIKKAAAKIPLTAEEQSDRSMLIKLTLGNKKYKILKPTLFVHSDDAEVYSYTATKVIANVSYGGIRGNDVNKWKDQKLKTYVKQQQSKGLHIATEKEMKSILDELGKIAGLTKDEDKIAMLMYLTGMDGNYWLMGDRETSNSPVSLRGYMRCNYTVRGFPDRAGGDDKTRANLIMIARE